MTIHKNASPGSSVQFFIKFIQEMKNFRSTAEIVDDETSADDLANGTALYIFVTFYHYTYAKSYPNNSMPDFPIEITEWEKVQEGYLGGKDPCGPEGAIFANISASMGCYYGKIKWLFQQPFLTSLRNDFFSVFLGFKTLSNNGKVMKETREKMSRLALDFADLLSQEKIEKKSFEGFKKSLVSLKLCFEKELKKKLGSLKLSIKDNLFSEILKDKFIDPIEKNIRVLCSNPFGVDCELENIFQMLNEVIAWVKSPVVQSQLVNETCRLDIINKEQGQALKKFGQIIKKYTPPPQVESTIGKILKGLMLGIKAFLSRVTGSNTRKCPTQAVKKLKLKDTTTAIENARRTTVPTDDTASLLFGFGPGGCR